MMAGIAGLAGQTIETPLSIGSFTTAGSTTRIAPVEVLPKSLSFVGDVLLARRVETYLDAYGSSYVYSALPPVSSTTVLIGNFEAAIPEEHIHTPDLTFSFSVDAQHIPALRTFGFQYMSLANNHAGDKGDEALLHTKAVLRENNVRSFGSPDELSTSSIEYVSLQDKKVALVGLNAVFTSPSNTQIQELLSTASQHSDIQIVSVHWGDEYKPIHSRSQEILAQTLIDAGADVIIGHHPHVVQDIGMYKGVPIFYSLGNFIFDQYFSAAVQEGLWVELTFEGNSVQYTLQGVTSIDSRSVPRFMTASENDVFLKVLAKKSSDSVVEQLNLGMNAQ
jgi:poly-gamma-glutamate synthesis protein (capsule biosynthesis protein)